MSEPPGAGAASTDVGEAENRPAWEVPEKVAVALLASVVVLAMGGLAAGIARFVVYNGEPFPGNQAVWSAIEFGAQWADVFVAAVLLAVLGLCWWQLQAWAEVIEDPDDAGQLLDAVGHTARALHLARGGSWPWASSSPALWPGSSARPGRGEPPSSGCSTSPPARRWSP